MATFTYTAVDETGKKVTGSVVADTEDQAKEQVKNMGVTVVNVAQGTALNADIKFNFMEKGPKPRDIAVFCRQMVAILNAGVGMSEALEMVAMQTENNVLRSALEGCRENIRGGMSMSESMKNYPKAFQDVFCTMIGAGEESGSLDISFTRMGEQAEKSAAIKALVKKSLMYPIVLLCVVVAVVIVMMVFIVPKFEDFIGGLGGEMPAFTMMIMNMSAFIKNNIVLIAGGGVGIGIFIKWFKKQPAGKRIFGKIGLKAPLIGKLTVKTACANTMRTLSTMLATGIGMVDALEITADTMSNVYFRDALLKVKEDVSQGITLSEALEATHMFPDMVFHMAKIGEETGDLVTMFDTSADYYDEEVKSTTESVTAAMEPLVIIMLAGIVGPIVIALLMPMMSMYSSLSEA